MTTGAHNIFPTAVFQHDIQEFSTLNEKLLGYVKGLQAEDPQGIHRSNTGGGWHSSVEDDIRDVPELAAIKRVIMDATKIVLDGMGFEGLTLALSAVWFIVSPAGAGNVRHNHPRAFLSGVYYVKAPEGSSPICFHDPRPARTYAMPQGKFKSTPYTGDNVIFEAQEGRLLIFPSWLDHSVASHQAEGERVSLSFNFIAM